MEDCTSTSASVGTASGVTSIGGQRTTHVDHVVNFIENLNANFPGPSNSENKPIGDQDIQHKSPRIKELKGNLALHYATKGSWSSPRLQLDGVGLHSIEDYYVPLHLNLLTRDGNRTKEVNLPLCELLGEGPVRRVLLQGDGGHGKSALCDKLMREWASPSSDFPSLSADFDLAFLIRFQPDLETTVEEEVIKLWNTVCKRFDEPHEILSILNSIGHRLLIVADGYNDASSCGRTSIEKIIGYKQGPYCSTSSLRQATIVMTSRPPISCGIYTLFDRFMSIANLSSASQLTYVDLYFADAPDQGECLKKVLNDDNVWFGKAFPLFFRVVCYLYRQGVVVDEDKENFWEQFLGLVHRKSKNGLDTKDFGKLKLKLGKMCYYSLKKGEVFLEWCDIKDEFKADQAEFIRTCGIFHNENNFLQPVHKMLMEYLTMQYLKNQWERLDNEKDRQDLLSDLQMTDTVHLLMAPRIFCCWIEVLKNSIVFFLCLKLQDEVVTSKDSNFMLYNQQREYLVCMEERLEFSASLTVDARPSETTSKPLNTSLLLERFVMQDSPLIIKGFQYLSSVQGNDSTHLNLNMRCNRDVLEKLPTMLRQSYVGEGQFSYSLDLFRLSWHKVEADICVINTYQELSQMPPRKVKGHFENRLLVPFLNNHPMRSYTSFRFALKGLSRRQLKYVKMWLVKEIPHVNWSGKLVSCREPSDFEPLPSCDGIFTLAKGVAYMSEEDPVRMDNFVSSIIKGVFKTVEVLKELRCDPVGSAAQLLNINEEAFKSYLISFSQIFEGERLETGGKGVEFPEGDTFDFEIRVQSNRCEVFNISKNSDSLAFLDMKLYFEFEALGIDLY